MLWKRLPTYLVAHIISWTDDNIIVDLQDIFPHILRYRWIDINLVKENVL